MTAMAQQRGATQPRPSPDGAAGGRPAVTLIPVLGAGLLLLAAAAAVHLTQGTAAVGAADLWSLLVGGGTGQEAAVVMQSRVPRLLAALLVGASLGAAGSVLQGLARNPLASPDTLAVEAGAFFALTATAAFGISVPLLTGAGVAFAGGLAAAALVLALTGAAGASTLRLILGGTVVALGLASLTSALMLFFSQETRGLFAWGAGSLGQRDISGVTAMAPVVLAGLAMVLLLSRTLDVLELGDDTARTLGIGVRRSRALLVVLAVGLSAAAVTIAGPIGFIGLCAPAAVRLAAGRFPGLRRHVWRVPASALAGAVLLLSADVALRMLFGPLSGVEVPTGVVTTLIGAAFLIVLARRSRATTDPAAHEAFAHRRPWGRDRFGPVIFVGITLLLALVVASLLLGDAVLLLGDLANFMAGSASDRVAFILQARIPRILAAVLAGACLALAGGIVQATTRNPLSDPGILGVSAGAGLGAVLVLTFLPGTSFGAMLAGAMLAAAVTAALLFALAGARGADPTRVVLVGVGLAAAAGALTAMTIVRSDPWNQAKAIAWLGGSTYGAQVAHQVPMAFVLVAAAVVLAGRSRTLDILALDELTPRLLGIRTGRTRLGLLLVAVGLTAAATASVGVIAFVGLIAPHAARLIVGAAHRRMLPLAAVLGAGLVLLADTIGRTVLAPNQLPAGLVTALIGSPYFLYLMRRTQGVRP